MRRLLLKRYVKSRNILQLIPRALNLLMEHLTSSGNLRQLGLNACKVVEYSTLILNLAILIIMTSSGQLETALAT